MGADISPVIKALFGFLSIPWLAIEQGAFFFLAIGIIVLAVASIVGFKSYNKKKAKVLLVDNDPDSLDLLTQILKNKGCDYTIEVNEKNAIEALKKENYDFMFLENDMPEMDGIEMLSKAENEMPKNKNVPVVFYSTDKVNCQKIPGMNHFNIVDGVSKKMPSKQLSKKVNQWLEEAGPL